METEIVSSEKVRPSSPTPHSLQTYKLSMLDQVSLPFFIPIPLFFPNANNPENNTSYQTTKLLKHSLSTILTRYYPLAGILNEDGLSIDCNDQGLPFIVVNIKGHKLSDFLRNPDPLLYDRLLPNAKTWGLDGSVATIQVSYFVDCGGITIASLFWHRIGDAQTMCTILNSWAATTRTSGKIPISPNYIVQSLFPQTQLLSKNEIAFRSTFIRKGNSVFRHYVFDGSMISILKAKTLAEGVDRRTRIEVVTALIWKYFMAASLANNKSVSMITHAVNLRRRARPPYPSDCFGNYTGTAVAICDNNNHENNLGFFVEKIREAINKIDEDYVNRMMGDEGFLGYNENQLMMWGEIPKGADILAITSWCGFDLYGVDFGWGKPFQLAHVPSSGAESTYLNMAGMRETRDGDGIEVLITLDEKYKTIFDNINQEIPKTSSSADPELG